MVDLQTRLFELAGQGFECSQILAILTMEMEDTANPDVVRAMSGLTGGMGHSGGVCGCLTGGCCVIGLLSGKGEPEELEHSRSREMIQEYIAWFQDIIGSKYGGIDCEQIIRGDFSLCITVCKPIIEACFERLTEILEEYDCLL